MHVQYILYLVLLCKQTNRLLVVGDFDCFNIVDCRQLSGIFQVKKIINIILSYADYLAKTVI